MYSVGGGGVLCFERCRTYKINVFRRWHERWMPATPLANNADNAAGTLHSLLTLQAAAGLFHHSHSTMQRQCACTSPTEFVRRTTDRLLCYTYYKYDDDEVVFASAISFFAAFSLFSPMSALSCFRCSTWCSCKLQQNEYIVKICAYFIRYFH